MYNKEKFSKKAQFLKKIQKKPLTGINKNIWCIKKKNVFLKNMYIIIFTTEITACEKTSFPKKTVV